MDSLAKAAFSDVESEFKKTRTMLERVPSDHLDWQPHEKSWPLIRMAAHVANLPSWVGYTLNLDGIDFANKFPPTPVPKNREELLAAFDAQSSEALDLLSKATDEDLALPWTLQNGDHIIFTSPKYEVIRVWAINHIIHHRAQLTMYYRLLDVPVPPLFGPSADES
jgi:uncharacterized damage-inducible protein DinB